MSFLSKILCTLRQNLDLDCKTGRRQGSWWYRLAKNLFIPSVIDSSVAMWGGRGWGRGVNRSTDLFGLWALEMDWSLAFYRYFHGNDIHKHWKTVKHKFYTKQTWYNTIKKIMPAVCCMVIRIFKTKKKMICIYLISSKSLKKHFKHTFGVDNATWWSDISLP